MTVSFIDITGVNANKAPLVKGGIRAYYATGSQGIAETAAQIAAAKAAGMGVVLIDQTPGLALFRAGLADVGDIEYLAGTDWSADSAVAQRQAHTWQSTLYVSYSGLPALKGSIANLAGVLFGVADYSWSEAEAEALLNGNPDWAYCQFGDPASNPTTLVPGTGITLAQCNADIDVAQSSWAAQFVIANPAVAVVPDVVGMRVVAQAEPAITGAGLTYHVNPGVNPDDTNVVVSQTPGPGVVVARGSNVDLGVTTASG